MVSSSRESARYLDEKDAYPFWEERRISTPQDVPGTILWGSIVSDKEGTDQMEESLKGM